MLVAPVFGVHPLGFVVEAVASEVLVAVPYPATVFGERGDTVPVAHCALVGLLLVGAVGVGADV